MRTGEATEHRETPDVRGSVAVFGASIEFRTIPEPALLYSRRLRELLLGRPAAESWPHAALRRPNRT